MSPTLSTDLIHEIYTKLYDAVVEAIHKVSPETKFVGMSDSYAGGHSGLLHVLPQPQESQAGDST